MHYIHLLRPMCLDDRGNLKIVLTITNDLGDSFLSPPQPVPITIYLCNGGTSLRSPKLARLTPAGHKTSWREGMRVLKLDLTVPAETKNELKRIASKHPNGNGHTEIRIMASSGWVEPLRIVDFPFLSGEGRIMDLSAPLTVPGQEPVYLAKRRFKLSSDDFYEVTEEIGDSIDRHLWDAGVVTTGVIANMLSNVDTKTQDHPVWEKTPLLKELLRSTTRSRPLNILELGCGVGILGLGLAAALQKRLNRMMHEADTTPSKILLTDLPGAEGMAKTNISLQAEIMKRSDPSSTIVVDFERLDWVDGKDGKFGPKVGGTIWDLIILSDCTYNVDVLPALVGTLSALSNKTTKDTDDEKHTMVMVATKPRHFSEKAMFDLMNENGWEIIENASQRLLDVGKEDVTVEIYLFR